ncbi:MAG: hypothetical protein ABSE89_11835 [Sedimentisphaerales bacterium]
MSLDYSVEFSKSLHQTFEQLGLFRPARQDCYEPQTELVYDFEPVDGSEKVKVKLVIEDFVGGGFAGQVYKVKILDVGKPELCPDLTVGKICAMKILVPPSSFSRLFRNLLYWIGFGAPFQLQVNPAAAKAGSLWQKFIRRAAKIKFGNEKSIVDIFGTFIDNKIGSCGEIREWVEGRTWRLEVDDHVDLLKKWRKNKKINPQKLGSPEYRAKYVFMHEFVKLLHEIGAYEFARQYEWTTLKSQPNCLKRLDAQSEPDKGLVAVDFRAGLTLLPFLPMSPGDIKLIFQGIKRGSLVQFDRGDLNKLKMFIDNHPEDFKDMLPMFNELIRTEDIYRNSIPDITHNHIRLLSSGKLWSTIFDIAVVGWRVKNIVDEKGFEKLHKSRFKIFIFFLIGLLPILGGILRKFWCNENWRRHYVSILTSFEYFKKAARGKIIELLLGWHKAGRLSQQRTEKFLRQPWRILYHLPFLLLISPSLHRLLTDWQAAKEKIYYFTVRPVKLYFNAEFRSQWLRDMVGQGKKKHILTEEDARTILSQVDEPFIDKYLKSLAVHICCLPITQIVSMIVAVIYIMKHPELTWKESIAAAGAIMVIFHIIPVSPGSIVRGLYVIYVAIRDKSFKDYNIAVVLAFFKIIGYLAFPIQMTYRYPALARFMAAHWATEAVHIVPVFGERGSLLEHGVFCLFYNWPLTIRRRMWAREAWREKSASRYWHIIPTALLTSICLMYFGRFHFKLAAVLLSLVCGMLTTVYCGRASLLKRFSASAAAGFIMTVFYTLFTAGQTENVVVATLWRCFVFALLSTIGAILTELSLPDVENHIS